MKMLRDLISINELRVDKYQKAVDEYQYTIKVLKACGTRYSDEAIRDKEISLSRILGKLSNTQQHLRELRAIRDMEARTIEVPSHTFSDIGLEEIHHVQEYCGTFSVVFHGGREVSADTLEKACDLANDLIQLWVMREKGICE